MSGPLSDSITTVGPALGVQQLILTMDVIRTATWLYGVRPDQTQIHGLMGWLQKRDVVPSAPRLNAQKAIRSTEVSVGRAPGRRSGHSRCSPTIWKALCGRVIASTPDYLSWRDHGELHDAMM
jgi:hypothetical protein